MDRMHRRELLVSCDEHLGVGRGDPLRAHSREARPIGASTGVAGRGRGDYGVSCIAESESRFGVPTGVWSCVGPNRRIGFDRLHTLRALASSAPANFEGVVSLRDALLLPAPWPPIPLITGGSFR